MRKLCVLVMCLGLGLVASAQGPGDGVIFFQHRQFKIPFKNDQKNINVAQVRLYVSTDQGRRWQYTATASPDEQHFRFSTPSDGLFWFAVQTVDAQGRMFPPTQEDFRANLKVIVDTIPPVVNVQPLAPRGNEVGVAWSVKDENLDLALPDSVRVEYRIAGGVSWIPLQLPLGGNQIYWDPRTNAQLEVRVIARDRAGNLGEDKTTVALAGGGGFNPGLNTPLGGGGADPFVNLERKFVNSKQISLSYDLKDVGPSGVSSVELWYTLYKGRAYNKLGEFPLEVKSPLEAGERKKLTFDVTDEGIYGISLVAKSGVGLGEKPPLPGDRPQFWIEVDLTKPIVQLHDVLVGTGPEKGKLSIAWTARDKNLGPQPIRLSYGEQKDGPWTLFADKLGNNGKHIWKMPADVPYQFYLRVEAIDLAGNVGEAITMDRIRVDLSQPKANIIGIEPGR